MASSRKIDTDGTFAGSRSELDFDNGKAKPERGINAYARIVLFAAILGGLIFGLDIGANSATTTHGFRDAMGFPRKLPGQEDSIETTNKLSMFGVVFHIFSLVGALPSGLLADKYGRKFVIMAAMILLLVGDIWQVLSGVISSSSAWANCLVGRAFAGIGVGFTLTIMPLYAAELSPSNFRGKVVTCFQLFITIGILVVSLINQIIQNETWGWRLSIGIQIIPVLVVMYLCVAVLPESPKYLVKVDKSDEARETLFKLSKGEEHIEDIVNSEINAVEAEVHLEKSAGSVSIRDLFHGTLWPAFLCGFLVAFCQNITGVNYFQNWGTTLFSTLNLDTFLFDTILKVLNVLATFVAIMIIDRAGRKPLLLWGTVLVLVIFGVLAAVIYGVGVDVESTNADKKTQSVQYFVVACIYMFQIVFAITWGPIAWLIPSEVFELKARGIGMGAAVFGNMLTNIALGDYGYKAIQSAIGLPELVLVLLGFNFFLVLPVVLWLVPETKNVSLEDMHHIFAYERGGNTAKGHGTMAAFFARNLKQSKQTMTCKKIEPLQGLVKVQHATPADVEGGQKAVHTTEIDEPAESPTRV